MIPIAIPKFPYIKSFFHLKFQVLSHLTRNIRISLCSALLYMDITAQPLSNFPQDILSGSVRKLELLEMAKKTYINRLYIYGLI